MVSSAYTYLPTEATPKLSPELERGRDLYGQELPGIPSAPAGALVPSCLDTRETTVQMPAEPLDSGQPLDSPAIVSALLNLPAQSATLIGSRSPEELAKDVKDCGERVRRFICCGCDALHDFPVFCGFKLCPICERRRVARLLNRYATFFSQMDTPVFITLTLKNYPRYSLSDMWKDMLAFFSTLRSRKIWAPIAGGIRTIEVTWNVKEETWHLHCHCLVDMPGGIFDQATGAYRIPWKALSEEWSAITGGSWSVDLRRAYQDSLVEVVKYLTKSYALLSDPLALEELIQVSFGKRLVQPFGSWYGTKIVEKSEEPAKCPECHEGKLIYLGVFDPREESAPRYQVAVTTQARGPGDPLETP